MGLRLYSGVGAGLVAVPNYLGTYTRQPGEVGVVNIAYPIGDLRRYGSPKGDGTANDAGAVAGLMAAVKKAGQYGTLGVQGAIASLPPGIFRLDSAVDMTGYQRNLRGAGQYQTVLRGNTAGVLIDQTESGFSTIEDLLIDDVGMSTPSTIGILQARDPSNAQANNNDLRNVVVRLGHSATAYGNRGTVGIYNCCCENTAYRNVTLRGDVGLYIGSGNLYGVASPIIGAIGHDSSMTVVTVDGCSYIVGLSGPAVRINAAAKVRLTDTSLGSQYNQVGLSQPYQYAIELLAQMTALEYSGSMEGFPSLLYVAATLAGIKFDCYAAHDSTPANARIVMAGGAFIYGGHINVVPTPPYPGAGSGTPAGYLISAPNGYANTLQSVDIDLYTQGLNLGTNGSILGCTIRSSDTMANTNPRIIAGTRHGNVIHCSDGIITDA